MPNIVVRPPTSDELSKVQQLRHEVLDPARKIDVDHELGPEDLAIENIQMVALIGEDVVGAVRLDLVAHKPVVYEVRKMAVGYGFRGQGVGQRILKAVLAEAESRGCNMVRLDARQEAIPFFEKLGFVRTGLQIVHEDGVPNYTMQLHV